MKFLTSTYIHQLKAFAGKLQLRYITLKSKLNQSILHLLCLKFIISNFFSKNKPRFSYPFPLVSLPVFIKKFSESLGLNRFHSGLWNLRWKKKKNSRVTDMLKAEEFEKIKSCWQRGLGFVLKMPTPGQWRYLVKVYSVRMRFGGKIKQKTMCPSTSQICDCGAYEEPEARTRDGYMRLLFGTILITGHFCPLI